jgi:probable HAF family extracellular repeat protein
MVWEHGSLIDLGTLSGSTSWAHGINDRGQVVGQSDTAAGATRAFLWDGGGMADLGTLGGPWAEALAINERGLVVGDSSTPSGEGHAALWTTQAADRALDPLAGVQAGGVAR